MIWWGEEFQIFQHHLVKTERTKAANLSSEYLTRQAEGKKVRSFKLKIEKRDIYVYSKCFLCGICLLDALLCVMTINSIDSASYMYFMTVRSIITIERLIVKTW